MTMNVFHPEHLQPGHMVGSWRIVESLGSGNLGYSFKVEREGGFYTLKMAVRPAPELPPGMPEKPLEERYGDRGIRQEATILLANANHPGLPHLRAMGMWPHPTQGYLYIVIDLVDGEPFHKWRERTWPTAAQLVDIFIEVVRVVARLHRRGILLRDFKSEHVIIGSPESKPVLVDLGSAWQPVGTTFMTRLTPVAPHTLPPECVTFIREEFWKPGARFEPNEAEILYQFGIFMYEALTGRGPFNPRLKTDELLTAIQTVIPRAPHRLNPEVPEPLSRIAMRLLEKRPEDRYESAEALLQALRDAAKARAQRAWNVPLMLPAEGPPPLTQAQRKERRIPKEEAECRAQEVEEKAARRKKRWGRIALVVGSLLLGLALLAAG
jgi:serine/threonine protein kinase